MRNHRRILLLWLAYSIAFTIAGVFLLYRIQGTNWTGIDAMILQVLAWGAGNILWFLAALVYMVVGPLLPPFGEPLVQQYVSTVLVIFGFASAQFWLIEYIRRRITEVVRTRRTAPRSIANNARETRIQA